MLVNYYNVPNLPESSEVHTLSVAHARVRFSTLMPNYHSNFPGLSPFLFLSIFISVSLFLSLRLGLYNPDYEVKVDFELLNFLPLYPSAGITSMCHFCPAVLLLVVYETWGMTFAAASLSLTSFTVGIS